MEENVGAHLPFRSRRRSDPAVLLKVCIPERGGSGVSEEGRRQTCREINEIGLVALRRPSRYYKERCESAWQSWGLSRPRYLPYVTVPEAVSKGRPYFHFKHTFNMRQKLPSPNVKLYNFIDDLDHTANDANTEDYRTESARLNSFKNWPVTYINPEQLAIAGFYYTGHRDLVKCFECSVKVGEWVTGDDPIVEHRKFSPTCDHAKRIPFVGLPIIQNYGVLRQPSEPGRDICGIYKDEYLNFTSNVENAKHRRYSSYDDRLSSFRFWNTSTTPTKERLAAAGFFYTGTRDQTLCFYCGVGLCDWQPYEDPWEMHCFWMPNCYYLLSIKGQDYPQTVRQSWSQRQQTSQPERQELPSAALPAIEPRNEPSVPEEIWNRQTNTGNILENIIVTLSKQNCEEDGGASCIASSPESLPTEAEHLLCRICYNEMRDILFLPCNHIVTCGTCASRIEKCPVCRMKITCTFRVRYD